MTDLSLRLPNRRLRAVLNLGPKNAAKLTLPERFAAVDLFVDWDDADELNTLIVTVDDGQVHFELHDGQIEHHYHHLGGGDTTVSPWPADETELLLTWAGQIGADFQLLMPRILDDIAEAAAWHDEGYDLYVCEVEEPTQLDLIEVEVEGELMTLPWLGAGTVTHEHIEGEDHPIALLWTPLTAEPDQPIAEAWLDSVTELPRTKALPGSTGPRSGCPPTRCSPGWKGST